MTLRSTFARPLLPLILFTTTTGCSLLTEPRPHNQSKKTLDLSVERTRSVAMDRDITRTSEGYYQFLVGQLKFDSEDFPGAKTNLQLADSLIGAPTPELNVRLAELELKEGNLEAALKESTRALEAEPNEVKTLLLHAGILDSLERGAEAVPFYEKILDQEPSSVDGYLILSGLHLKLNQPMEAIAVLKRYLVIEPNDPLVLYFLGRAYEATDDLETAEQTIQRAYELNGENLALGVDYARILVRRSKTKNAKDVCRHILERDPQNIVARKILGSLLIGENHLDEALEQLRLLQDIEEDPTETRFKIALINLQQRRFSEAEQGLQLLIAQQPNHAAARYYLATILASTNRIPQALEQIAQIPLTNELYAKANAFSSFICKEAGNLPCALESIKKAYESDQGQSPQIFTFYIAILRDAKQFDEARTLLESAIEKQPEAYDLRYDYVMTLHDLGEIEAAYQEALAIIAANPEHAESLNFVAYIMAEREEDLGKAEELIRRAIRLRPREGYFHDTLGWVLLKRGQTKESIAELRHASELLPRDSTILEHLADAQAISGDTREASTTYERAIEALSASIQETGAQESGAQENSLDRLRLEQKKDALSEVLRP